MERFKLFESKIDCCACGACEAICNKKAIHMEEDDIGFLYPAIDFSLCVGCEACKKICSYQKAEKHPNIETYAAIGTIQSMTEKSSSGGIFATIANALQEKGGYICGAVMSYGENQIHIEHLLSNNYEDIKNMQGSKYVQSSLKNIFSPIKKALKEGNVVLFCGTPCQVAAIKKYTLNPKELITIDLICHGVPSARFFNNFIDILSKRFHGKVTRFTFRSGNKKYRFCSEMDVRRGNKTDTFCLESGYLSYYQYFLQGATYRENCYHCPYACLERTGDITIGDFWGVEKVHAKEVKDGLIDPTDKWSCLMINTEKGKSFIEKNGKNLKLIKSKVEWVALNNNQLRVPSTKNLERDNIFYLYKNSGYHAVEEKYMCDSAGSILKFKIGLLRRIVSGFIENNRLLNKIL